MTPSELKQWREHAYNCYNYAKSLTEGDTNASLLAERILQLLDLAEDAKKMAEFYDNEVDEYDQTYSKKLSAEYRAFLEKHFGEKE